MKKRLLVIALIASGCASVMGPQWNPGPEYNQKVLLLIDDEQKNFQAAQSTYDIGDLQAFHSQHTFPILVEGAFKEIFGEVQRIQTEAGIEADTPDVPAVFEVHMIDLAHDIYMEADSYRAQTTVAVAMKSPSGEVLWQQAFRGEGYVNVDPQFSTGLGPQDAVVDAVGDALYQMQKAIVNAPEIQQQLKFGRQAEQARREREIRI